MFRVVVFGGGTSKTKLSRERIYIEDYREQGNADVSYYDWL